jgi:mRNA interferase HigB
LKTFWELNRDCEQALRSWHKEASNAQWNTPNDIKSHYVTASILKSGRVVFNICGNKYRVVVDINYNRKWVFVRFRGSHKEYDRINANTI